MRDRNGESRTNSWWLLLAIALILVVGTIKKKANEPLKIPIEPSPTEEEIDSILIDIERDSELSIVDTLSVERATRYNPSEDQCDDTPYLTADQSFIPIDDLRKRKIRWCALSWDLIYDEYRQDVASRDWAWNGDIRFGDTIYVVSKSKPFINGGWVVHDVMNERYRKSIDFLFHEDNMVPRLGVCNDVKILIKRNG